MSEAHDPHVLPNRTTPTWEVELLISGVAVFAMLQLPGQLDDALFALEPRLGSDWRQILILGYIYGKSAAMILATTFVLHLLLRARWIALVGMHSVYPKGILLDKLRMGPIQNEVEQELDQPIPERIERADNLATTVFAIGVMLAMMLIGIAVGVGILYAGGALVAMASNGRIAATVGMFAIFAMVMLPWSAVALLDQHKAAQWPADDWKRRLIRACLRGYSHIGFSRSSNPIMALLASHGGDRKAIVLTTTVMFLALSGAGFSMAMLRDPGMLGSYAMFPQSKARHVDPAYYDDQRSPTRDAATPYVQSMVVAGPYLKLVVPYRPRLDDPAMRRTCPHTEELPQARRTDARLACLQALRAVTLDGRPFNDLQYEIASDPRTDRPALLAMIDVRDLPRGRHEIHVARPPFTDSKLDQDEPDPLYDAIPFWR